MPAKIRIFNISERNIPFIERLRAKAIDVAKSEDLDNIHIIFCGDAYIRSLNRRFLGHDRATDVLSFNYNEPGLAGEIYISFETARRHAQQWQVTLYRELRRLIVHGCLHLAGHDHHHQRQRRLMRQKETIYLE